jgi:hypothetical protein
MELKKTESKEEILCRTERNNIWIKIKKANDVKF